MKLKLEPKVSLDRKAPSQASAKSGAQAEAVSSKGEVSVAESNRSVSIPPSHVSDAVSEVSDKTKVCNFPHAQQKISHKYVTRGDIYIW